MHTNLPFAVARTLAVAGFTALLAAGSARAGWVQTAAGTYEYNDTANWAGGTIDDLFPGTLSIAGNQALTFNADRTLPDAWSFLYDGTGNLTLSGTGANRMVALGGDFTLGSVSAARTVTFGSATAGENLNVALGAALRTFMVATGDTATFLNAISGGIGAGNVGLLKAGAGTLTLRAQGATASTYTGNLQLDGGVFETVQSVVSLTTASAVSVLGNAANDIVFNGGTWRADFAMDGTGRLSSGHQLIVNNVVGNTLHTPTRLNLGTVNQLTGSGALLKTGTDGLYLFAANDYSGTLTVQQGLLSLRAANALTSAATINLGGGTLILQFAASTVFTTPVIVSGNSTLTTGLTSGSAGLTMTLGNLSIGAQTLTVTTVSVTSGTEVAQFTGTHTLTGSPTFSVANPTGAVSSLTLNGALGDGGSGFGFTKLGTGRVTLSGTAANTFTGLVTVNAGTVVLGKTANVPAIGGNVTVTGGAVTYTGTSNNQIVDTATVNVSGGYFNANGLGSGVATVSETIANLNVSGTGNFTAGTTSQWTVTNAATWTAGSSYTGSSGSSANFTSLSLTGLNATTSGTNGAANAFGLYGNNAAQAVVAIGGGGLALDGSNVLLRRSSTTGAGSRIVLGGDVTTTGSAPSAIIEDTSAYLPISGSMEVQLGSVAAPVTRTFTVGGGADLTISVPVGRGAGTTAELVKAGPGKLVLTALQNYDTLTASAGRTDLAGALGTGTSTLNANAQTNISAAQTLAALNIGPGAVVTFGALPASPLPAETFAPALAAVPEPATAAPLLAGLGTLLGLPRFRRRA